MAKIKWHGKKLSKKVKKAAVEGLTEGIDFILEEANRDAPKDEGILIQTSSTDVDQDKLEASVYYTQPYAKRLHEHPEYNFQNGRKGKWLESTLKDKGKEARSYIDKKIKDAMKG